MPLQGQYPNAVFMVDLTGQARIDYMRAVAELYNDLKAKGYPVPAATIVDEGSDTSYLTLDGVSGDSMGEKVAAGLLDKSVAAEVYERALLKVSKMQKNENLIMYDMHQGKICYDEVKDTFMICDLTRTSKLNSFGRVQKFTPEHIEMLRLKAEEAEAELNA